MKKSFIPFIIPAAVLLISVSCSASKTVPSAETIEELGFYPVTENREVPEITFTDKDNNKLTLKDFRGSVVLINFWATWCPPCRAEMPSMQKLSDTLSNTDFVMLPVNVQEKPDIVEQFMKDNNLTFSVYYDPDAEAAVKLGIMALPSSILVDRNGNAVGIIQGAYDWNRTDFISMMKKWVK